MISCIGICFLKDTGLFKFVEAALRILLVALIWFAFVSLDEHGEIG